MEARVGRERRLRAGPLAQLAEQRTFNPWVVGSSPTGPTRCPRTEGCDLELDPGAGTIFFVHRGPIHSYVDAAILQARLTNPKTNIVVMGDQSPTQISFEIASQVRYQSLSDYSSRASAFAEIFRFEANHRYDYELLNFQRWFYLREFCEANSLSGPFLLLDSDAYLYLSMHEVIENLQSSMTVVDRVGPQFTFFLDLEAITKFTDFLTDCFSSDSGFRKLSNFVDEWQEHGLPRVCDMAALGSYVKQQPVEDIGIAERTDFVFCENVGSSQGLAMSMLGKKVTVINNRRYFTTKDARKVLAGGIHLQGGNKALWPYFVDKSVRREIRAHSPRAYRVQRAGARRKVFRIGFLKTLTLLKRLVSFRPAAFRQKVN